MPTRTRRRRPALILLAATSSLPLLASAQQSDPLASSKRGLVYVNPSAASDDAYWTSGDLTWYYNYGAAPSAALAHSGLQFVPMLWGASANSSDAGDERPFYDAVARLIAGGRNISYVLAFNEPDGCTSGGACLDAGTAARTWIREIEPLKTDFGLRLGAPAVTGAPTGFNWLQNFFTACAGQCTSDFIPVHWYGDFQGLASHIGQVNATYPNMTMWVTEYALPDASLAASQEFYNQSSEYMDRLPYITHYSYFGAFRSSVSNVGPNAAFLTQKGQLTDIGAWYLGEAATGNVPEAGAAARASRFVGWAALVCAAAAYCLI